MYDLFSNLIKYRSNAVSTPLENFTTELFVYIWKYLIESNKELARKVFKIFGITLDDKALENTTIETQKSTTILLDNGKKQRVIPDIWISVNSSVYLIEVKVNSSLNSYELNGKDNDQIMLYNEIDNIKAIKTLTKNVIFSLELPTKNKVLWSDIYTILEGSNELLILNFLSFLKENGMAPTDLLQNSSLSAISIYTSLLGIIETSWNIDKYKLERTLDPGWLGFYIKKDKKKIAWIGQLLEKQEHFVLELLDQKYIKKAEKDGRIVEFDNNGNPIVSKLPLSEIIKHKKPTAQKEVFQKWLNTEVNNFIDFS